MKFSFSITCLAAALASLPLARAAEPSPAPARIVGIGGAATEILFAVGAGPQVVAVDQSSTWPPEAAKLPQVGYIRVISPESVLAAKPTLIVTTTDIGPPEAVAKLEAAGAPLLKVPAPNSAESVAAAITAIAERTGHGDDGKRVRAEFEKKMKRVAELAAKLSPRPKVALFMSVEGSSFNAAGAGTKADGLIRLIGGENVFENFTSYRPVSAEAVVAAAPDVILIATMPERLKEAEKSVRENPALAATPARRNDKVRGLDLGAALNFGPRLADSALSLAEYLSAEKASAPPVAKP